MQPLQLQAKIVDRLIPSSPARWTIRSMEGEETRPESPPRSLDQLIDDSNRLRNEVHRLTVLSQELSRQIEKLLGEHAHAAREHGEHRHSNEPNK